VGRRAATASPAKPSENESPAIAPVRGPAAGSPYIWERNAPGVPIPPDLLKHAGGDLVPTALCSRVFTREALPNFLLLPQSRGFVVGGGVAFVKDRSVSAAQQAVARPGKCHVSPQKPKLRQLASLEFRYRYVGFDRVSNETILMRGMMHFVELFCAWCLISTPGNLRTKLDASDGQLAFGIFLHVA
jgi:hypothetical protein